MKKEDKKNQSDNTPKNESEIKEGVGFIRNALVTDCKDIENWELQHHLDELGITSHNYVEKFTAYKMEIPEDASSFLARLKEIENTANKLKAPLKKNEGTETDTDGMNLSDFSSPITPNRNSKRDQGTTTVTNNTSSKLQQTVKKKYNTKKPKPGLRIEEKQNTYIHENRWKKTKKRKKHWNK